MFKNHTVGVVIPAFNESKLIGKVIETIPDYVDSIIVVDDFSQDDTCDIVKNYQLKLGDRLHLIEHKTNQGVGGAIATGYKWCRDQGMDITQINMLELDSKLLAAGQKFYGAWSEAVRTAGFNYSEIKAKRRDIKRRKKSAEEALKNRKVFIIRDGLPVSD